MIVEFWARKPNGLRGNEIMMGIHHIFVQGLIPEGSLGCLVAKLSIRVLTETLAANSINKTPRLWKSATT